MSFTIIVVVVSFKTGGGGGASSQISREPLTVMEAIMQNSDRTITRDIIIFFHTVRLAFNLKVVDISPEFA